jgi:putative DNA primase/helicase
MIDIAPTVVSIGLIRTAFTSQHVPQLLAGHETHEPALKFAAQLVAHTDDDERIHEVVVAALPENYAGDTLKELPGMIATARRKGFGERAVSSEFSMTERGLLHHKPKGNSVVTVFVSGPFEVRGLARDDKGAGWSRLLLWRDADGEEHKYLAGDRVLLIDHDAVCGDLAHNGLKIGKGQQTALAKYILGVHTDLRLTLVYRTGWHTIDGSAIFALPKEIIGDLSGCVVYEGDEQKRSEYAAKGTTGDWRQAVASLAGEHALATFAISAAFAGPLLQPAAQESGGIHIFGNSSTGKTTLLKLAASVWGDAGLVRSWRATANGLEGVADRTSDVVLILDELGQLDSKDAASSLYMLAGGVGKIRMNRDATLKDIRSWRAFIMSSGEMTVETKMTQMRGAKAYTGATLRLLNVEADRGLGFGVFDNAGSTGEVRELVEAFAEAAAECHGVAGPEFVKQLLARGESGEGVRNAIDSFVRNNIENGAAGQIERAAKRFGLIAAAGELATEFGITGWQAGVATTASALAFKKWTETRGGDGKQPAEDRAAIRQVTSTIVNYGESRFDEVDAEGFRIEVASDDEGNPRSGPRPALIRYGWRKHEGEKRVWMIEDSVWESEICKGFDPDQVSRVLARHGMLKCAKNRYTYAERYEGKRNKRFHVITAKILTNDYDATAADVSEDDDGLNADPGHEGRGGKPGY